MAKNHMADIAKMLGVELGEEFNINNTNTLYKITDIGLWYKAGNIWYGMSSDALIDLIKGDWEIQKIPWKPKDGDRYYRPADKFTYIVCAVWVDEPHDFAYQEAGMVFRTKGECEAALSELRKKYLGGDDVNE